MKQTTSFVSFLLDVCKKKICDSKYLCRTFCAPNCAFPPLLNERKNSVQFFGSCTQLQNEILTLQIACVVDFYRLIKREPTKWAGACY